MTRNPGPREFRDDDDGYTAWLAAHPEGYVINILRSHSTATARVHRAACWTISGQNPAGGMWTGPYKKVCEEDLAELEQWAADHVGEPIQLCGKCHPGVQPASTNLAEQAVAHSVPEGRSEIHGPVVQAWADDYIRFEHRPVWQENLRTKIRTGCQQLEPSAGQVLHATFFGPKLHNADVENIVLYYIGSFATAGRNGIRFEHGAAVPPAPGGDDYPFCYRYALAPRAGSFADWRLGRTLVSFAWTDLGAFGAEKVAAKVWLALARCRDEVVEPVFAPDALFAVRVEIRPPQGRQLRVNSDLVKGVLDGVICAFEAHSDATVLPEVVARLAAVLPADPAEIQKLLLDQRGAVLGVVQRLVYPYRNGVKWDPADHRCVAGELLAVEPVDERWAIKGEIVELSR